MWIMWLLQFSLLPLISKSEHSSSKRVLFIFYSYQTKLSLEEILIFPPFLKALLIFLLQCTKPVWGFKKILFLNFHLFYLIKIESLHIKLLCCLFIYWQTLSKFWNHQRVISITANSFKKSDIKYIWMSSYIYQDMTNQNVSVLK